MQLGIEIEQARKRIDGIQQRIDFLSLEKDAPGFVRMFSSARVPDQPTKGGRRKLFGLVLVAALVFGLAIPVAADALDPGVHTPRDLETALGFTPVAWLLDKRAAGPDFANEQLMRFASRIVQDQQASGSRIFALTAAKAGAGTSSLVMETAAAVTRLGISALAVEANAYNGDSRYSAKTSKGLRFVLTGSQKVEAAIVPGQSGMPDYIPVGEPQDEKNLPDIQKLIEVLRGSADAYSVVLIDLPPIMASVDAEFIARGSDVTVLVVEADTTTREEVKRAAACLSRIKVPAVSAILTKVAVDAGDGFARSARQEFISGSGSTAKGWLARKLWS
jgi:Mrp family chromosome partitioning ATPase